MPGQGGVPVAERLQGDEAADIDALVDELLGTTPRPVNWSRLSRDQAAARWAALDEWVRWPARRYSLDRRDIPPCWYAHGDLVEELSALHTAHQAAFDPAGPATGPADWHQHLANTRARMQTWIARTGCRRGQHRAPAQIEWAIEPAPTDYCAPLAEHVSRDLEHRAGI